MMPLWLLDNPVTENQTYIFAENLVDPIATVTDLCQSFTGELSSLF